MAIKTVLITQARSGSTRLPGKVLKTIAGKTMLQIHLERLKKCAQVDAILVATTTENGDEVIYKNAADWGYLAYRGSSNDVLDRFYQAAKPLNPEWVVRVTSDCPLIDPQLVDEVIKFTEEKDIDYAANVILEQFPDGQDIEVFTFAALEQAWKDAFKASDREHVTPYIRNNSSACGGNIFQSLNYPSPANWSHIRMTVDTIEDFKLIEILVNELGADKTWQEYTQYIVDNDLTSVNAINKRNEGLLKSIENDNR